MNELKPCPFCGDSKVSWEVGNSFIYCISCEAEGPVAAGVEGWNTRSTEEELRARIAELEAALAATRKAP